MKLCSECPFIAGSKTRYDEAAMEALDEGYDPACHSVVGRDSIFNEIFPGLDIACFGHSAWLNETPGFCKPKLIGI